MNRVKELDGIRGLAILLVLLHHNLAYIDNQWLRAVASWGWVGVDMFFVLSGFLITGILLRSAEQPNYYKGFYQRRAARIWPLYLCVLGFTALLNLRFHQEVPWLLFFLFVQNFLGAFVVSFDYLNVTWSLAVEEQFYFVWPVVVRNFNKRVLLWICLAVIIAEPILRTFATSGLSTQDIYRSTFFHIDGLAFGCLLSLVGKVSKKVSLSMLLVGASGAAAITAAGVGSALLLSAIAVCFAGLVSLSPKLFRFPVLCWLGTISYGVYLLHGLVSMFVQRPVLLSWGITIALSFISWQFLEKPILALASKRSQSSQEQRIDAHEVHGSVPRRLDIVAEG